MGHTMPSSPVTRQILADFLLVVPQQPVQGQNVPITNKGQAVVERVTRWAVRGDVEEKSRRKPKCYPLLVAGIKS